MIKSPCCQTKTYVADSRTNKDNLCRRRIVCWKCGQRYTTYERLQGADPRSQIREALNELRDASAEMRIKLHALDHLV